MSASSSTTNTRNILASLPDLALVGGDGLVTLRHEVEAVTELVTGVSDEPRSRNTSFEDFDWR